MGAKSSKAEDIFVTDEYTQSDLPADSIRKYGGSPCEYASIDVCLDLLQDGDTKPNSIVKVLSDASKRNFGLCFVTPKKDGQTMNFGRKLIWSEEEERAYLSSNSETETTHTVILNKDKLSAQAQKQQSLDRMEAKKTILNMMMEMHNRSAKFYIKQFVESMDNLDKTVNLLRKLITEEASKGCTLQCVVRLNNDENDALRLKLVFMLNKSKDEERVCEYSVELKKITHIEKALKVNKKKHPLPNSNRCTNTTCQADWLELFQDDAKIVEVISLDDVATNSKSDKKIKKRSFDVPTIWIYEKPLKKCNFEGLVRQVWTPLEKTLHENIKKEVWHFGDFGWVLATVLVTPHIRMKGDGSDHSKCVLFFQRRSNVHGNLSVVLNKEEDISECGELPAETNGKSLSSPPKDKAKAFGLGMISQDDLTHTKLRHTPQADESRAQESSNKQTTVNILSGVQLKKVDREKLKSEQASQDSQEQDQTVPWHASLQRKREAVQRNELKGESADDSLPKPTHAEQEIVQKLEEIRNKNTQEKVEVERDIPFIDASQDTLNSPPAKDIVPELAQPDVEEAAIVNEPVPNDASAQVIPVKSEEISLNETSEIQNEIKDETVSANNKSEVISNTNKDKIAEIENEKDEGVESKDDFSDYKLESRVTPRCLQQNLSQDEGIETSDSSKDMRSPDEETSVDFTKADRVEETTEKAKEITQDIAESPKVAEPTEDVVQSEKSTSEIATPKNNERIEEEKEPTNNETSTSVSEASAIKVIAELPKESKDETSDVNDDVGDVAAPDVKNDVAQPVEVDVVEVKETSTTIKETSDVDAPAPESPVVKNDVAQPVEVDVVEVKETSTAIKETSDVDVPAPDVKNDVAQPAEVDAVEVKETSTAIKETSDVDVPATESPVAKNDAAQPAEVDAVEVKETSTAIKETSDVDVPATESPVAKNDAALPVEVDVVEVKETSTTIKETSDVDAPAPESPVVKNDVAQPVEVDVVEVKETSTTIKETSDVDAPAPESPVVKNDVAQPAEVDAVEVKETSTAIKETSDVDVPAPESPVVKNDVAQPAEVDVVEVKETSTTIKETSDVDVPAPESPVVKNDVAQPAEVDAVDDKEMSTSTDIKDTSDIVEVDTNETSENEISKDERPTEVSNTQSKGTKTAESEDKNLSHDTVQTSVSETIDVKASEVKNDDKNVNHNNNLVTLQYASEEHNVKAKEVSECNKITAEETKPSKDEVTTTVLEAAGEPPNPESDEAIDNTATKSVTETTSADVEVVEFECNNTTKEKTDLIKDDLPASEVASADPLQNTASDEQLKTEAVDAVNSTSNENDVSATLQSYLEKTDTTECNSPAKPTPDQVLAETKDASCMNIAKSENAEAPKKQLEVTNETTKVTNSEAATEVITKPNVTSESPKLDPAEVVDSVSKIESGSTDKPKEPLEITKLEAFVTEAAAEVVTESSNSKESKDQLNASDSTKVVDNVAVESANKNTAQPKEITSVETSLSKVSNEPDVVESECMETPEVQAKLPKDETATVAVSESVNTSKPEETTDSEVTLTSPETSKAEAVDFGCNKIPEVQAELPKAEESVSEVPVEDATKASLDVTAEPPKLNAAEMIDNVSTAPVADASLVENCTINTSEIKSFSSTEIVEPEKENMSQKQTELQKEETQLSVAAEVVSETPQEPTDESMKLTCPKPDVNVTDRINSGETATIIPEPLQEENNSEQQLNNSEKSAEIIEDSDVVNSSVSPISNDIASKAEDVGVSTADTSINNTSIMSEIKEISDAEVAKSESSETEPSKNDALTSVPDAIAEIVSAAYLQSKDELAKPASIKTEVKDTEIEKSECNATLKEKEEPSKDETATIVTEAAAEVITEPSQEPKDHLSASHSTKVVDEVLKASVTETTHKSETKESSNAEIVKPECVETSQEQVNSISGVAEEVSQASVKNEDESAKPVSSETEIKDVSSTGLTATGAYEIANEDKEPIPNELTTTNISNVPAEDTSETSQTINEVDTSESTKVTDNVAGHSADKSVSESVDENAVKPEVLDVASCGPEINETSDAEVVKPELIKTEPSKNDESSISVSDVVAEVVNGASLESNDKLASLISDEPETKDTSDTEPTEKSDSNITLEVQAESSKHEITTLVSEPAAEISTESTLGLTIGPTESKPIEVVNDQRQDSTTPAAETLPTEIAKLENEDTSQEQAKLSKDEIPTSVSAVITEVVSEAPLEVNDESAKHASVKPEMKETSVAEVEKSEFNDTLKEKEEPSKDDTRAFVSETETAVSTESSLDITADPTISESTKFSEDAVSQTMVLSEPAKEHTKVEEVPAVVEDSCDENSITAESNELGDAKTVILESNRIAEQSRDEMTTSVSEHTAEATKSAQTCKDELTTSESTQLHVDQVVSESVNKITTKPDEISTEVSTKEVSDTTEINQTPEEVVKVECNESSQNQLTPSKTETPTPIPSVVAEPPKSESGEHNVSPAVEITSTVDNASETKESSSLENVKPECKETSQEQPDLIQDDLHISVTEVVAEVVKNVSAEPLQKAASDEQLKTETVDVVNSTSNENNVSTTLQSDLEKTDTNECVSSAKPSPDQVLTEAKDASTTKIAESKCSEEPKEQLEVTKESATISVSEAVIEVADESSQESKDQLSFSDSTKVVDNVAVESTNENAVQPKAIISVETSLKEGSSEPEVVESECKATPEIKTELSKEETTTVTVSESVNTSTPEETTASGETSLNEASNLSETAEFTTISAAESESNKTSEEQIGSSKEATSRSVSVAGVDAPTESPREVSTEILEKVHDNLSTKPCSEVAVIESLQPQTMELAENMSSDTVNPEIDSSNNHAEASTDVVTEKQLQDVDATVSITPSETHIQQLNVDDELSTAPSTSHDAVSNIAAAAIDNEEVQNTESIPCDVNDEKQSIETEKAHNSDNHNESYASQTPAVASESSSEVVTTEQSQVPCSTNAQDVNMSTDEKNRTQLNSEKTVDLISDSTISNQSPSQNGVDTAATASPDKAVTDDQAVKSGEPEENDDLLGENVIPGGKTNDQPSATTKPLPSDCPVSESSSVSQQQGDKTNGIEGSCASLLNSSVGQVPLNEPVKPSDQVKETNETKNCLLQEADAGESITTATTSVSQALEQSCANIKDQTEISIEKGLTSENSSSPESCSATGGDGLI